MTLRIDEGANHLNHRARIEDCKEWDLGAERIPQAVEGVKVWLTAGPERILPSVILGIDHCPVDSTVEVSEDRIADVGPRDSDWLHLLGPLIDCSLVGCIEVEVRNFSLGVSTSLLSPHEAHTHPGQHGVSRFLKANKSTTLSLY